MTRQTTYTPPWVARIWLRDGSVNYLPLPAAAMNVGANTANARADDATVKKAGAAAMRRLLDGEVLRTRLAEFRLVRRYGEAVA